MAEEIIVFQGRNPSTRTQREGRTVNWVTNDGNDPPPPYQQNAPTSEQANAQSDRPASVRPQSRTAAQQLRTRTTSPSPVYWSRVSEYDYVKASHWSHTLYALRRYEAKRNKISRIDFAYGCSEGKPEYYFSCHLQRVNNMDNFRIEYNLARIVMLYLRHRKRYDCDCSMARLCLDLRPEHVQVHAPTSQLDAAGVTHYLRTQSSLATTGCDFFEKERSWRDRRLAGKLTKALQRHSRQCTCQCFGAWATPPKNEQAKVITPTESRDLITLHRSTSSDCSREWDDASGKVITIPMRTTSTDTARQDRKEKLWGRIRRILDRKKDSKVPNVP